MNRIPRPDTAATAQALGPFFRIPTCSSVPLPDVLQPILDFREQLFRQERLAVLFGAVKTGKTSLINAMLGADVLPAHAFRSSHRVTTLSHAAVPVATVVRSGGETQEVPFDDLRTLSATTSIDEVSES